ncbi:cache domain-containing protein, partial [Aureimonas populi]
MNFKMSLPGKVVGMMLASLLVLAVLIMAASFAILRADGQRQAMERQEVNMGVAWEVLGRYGSEFSVADGSLYAGTTRLNDLTQPVDRIRELVAGTATIFMGDTRVSTNVLKPDGTRAVGTTLTAGPAYDAVLREGRPYRGEATILDVPYFTAYDPIKDAAGQTIGVLYVGIPQAEFFASIENLLVQIATIAALILVGMGALGFWLSRRTFAPLQRLVTVIAAVAERRTDVTVEGTARSDEIGGIARAVENLRLAVIDQKRLEVEAAALRERQESERLRVAEAERVKADELRGFVSDIESGFQR